MNRFLKYLIILLIIIGLGFYFASIVKNILDRSNPKEIKLWVSPTDYQLTFWTKAAEKWNNLGKGLKVVVRSIPAANSSAEAIFNSIASRNPPDICTNIFDGLAAQLAKLDVVYNLKDLEGYDELVKKRKIQHFMKITEYQGNNYMFPVLILPIPYAWRWDILQKLGWKDVPKTYSDVYKLANQFCTNKLKYALQVTLGQDWWNRWFDFISLYYAASYGKPYIKNSKTAFNNQYGKDVLEFFKKMYDNGWTPNNSQGTLYFYEGNCVGQLMGPYEIDFMKNNYPDLEKKIKIGPIIVPDNIKNKGYSFIDIKGMVVFKSSPHAKEAWDFARWVFNSDQMSILWMELSNQPAGRGDLLTNPIFKDFLNKNYILKEMAKLITNGRPSAPIIETADVQQVMTDDMLFGIVHKINTVDQALNIATKNINEVLMKE